jgi:hypothetical protein
MSYPFKVVKQRVSDLPQRSFTPIFTLSSEKALPGGEAA